MVVGAPTGEDAEEVDDAVEVAGGAHPPLTDPKAPLVLDAGEPHNLAEGWIAHKAIECDRSRPQPTYRRQLPRRPECSPRVLSDEC